MSGFVVFVIVWLACGISAALVVATITWRCGVDLTVRVLVFYMLIAACGAASAIFGIGVLCIFVFENTADFVLIRGKDHSNA